MYNMNGGTIIFPHFFGDIGMNNVHIDRCGDMGEVGHGSKDGILAIPRASCSPKRIDILVRGYKLSQILRTALELKIFALLKNPCTCEEIYIKLGTDPKLTKALLDALVSLGLVGKTEELYKCLDEAKEFLDADSHLYQGDFIISEINNYMLWNSLPERIRNTNNIKIQPNEHNKFDSLYTKAMAEVTMRQSLYQVVGSLLEEVPDFKTAESMLDLGGGHGLYSIAFTQVLSNLTSYVLDLPHVIEITREFIKIHRAEDRVNTIVGDIIYDELGNETYDIIFASHILYRHMCNKIRLDKIFMALKLNGVLIISQWMKTEQPNLSSALWDISLFLQGYNESALLKLDELKRLLNETFMAQRPPMLTKIGSCTNLFSYQSNFVITNVIEQTRLNDLATIIVARKLLNR